MSEDKNILDKLIKRKKPEVPNGYFDSFHSNLMDKMEEENGFLDDLKTSEKPEVPAGFFDSFHSNLMDKIKSEVMLSGSSLSADRVEAPSDDSEAKKSGRIIPLGVWATITSVAAVLTVMLWVYKGNENNELSDSTTKTEEYTLEDEDYDAYLTYVDEGEIIDFMIENEISLEDEGTTSLEDDVYDYVGDDIEDLYYEL